MELAVTPPAPLGEIGVTIFGSKAGPGYKPGTNDSDMKKLVSSVALIWVHLCVDAKVSGANCSFAQRATAEARRNTRRALIRSEKDRP